MTEPTIIRGRYEIGGFIGHGGMAEVFQGRDTQTGERVAIKHLRTDLTNTQPELIERFWRESDVLRKLDHPNIVKLLDTVEANGQYYLIMEYVGGGTLAELLQRQPQLPVGRALEIALELSDALARTHHLNVIHRDIKPTNILLTEQGTPRLTDFGLAFASGAPRLTKPGIALGTWLYVSPEVYTGAKSDERSDVWSFGVTLYEMLSGHVPFYGDSPASIIREIMHSPLVSTMRFREDIPAALDILIQRMLTRDTASRLASFRQIGAEIESIVASISTPLQDSDSISIPIEVQWTDEAAVETTIETPHLLTKLSMPPPRPNQVVRPRLLTALNEGIERGRKLTLVSAPPGFGKTTLVSTWLSANTRPVAWLSLDESDNDPVHFLQYLVAALERISPGVGQMTRLLLGAPQFPPPGTLLTPLINAVAVLPGFTFVLDDYHVITTERVHEALRFLLDHLPRSLHLVIISREDPPLPLPRLRVRDEMTQIRERDLRFSQDETLAFLNDTMHLQLPLDTTERLRERTEGWVAALQLAALGLQEGDQTLIADFSGDHRYMLDYLVSEVLEQQPPQVRDFLRQTSILDQLSAPLCDALLNSADSARLLEQLEHANLFLIPLDSKRKWYRYHSLFADVLQLTLTPEERARLHGRAADWFAAQDVGLDAVHHALTAAKITNDYQQTINLIQTYIERCLDEGRLTTVLGWLDRLPETEFHAYPDFSIYKAWILIALAEPARSEGYIAAAEKHWDTLSAASRGRLRLAQCFLALAQGDLVLALQFAQESAELLIDDSQAKWRIIALWALAETQERGAHITEAIASMRKAVNIGYRAGSPLFTSLIELSLATALNINGQRHEAISVCQTALARCRVEHGQPVPTAAPLLCKLAELAYDANDLVAAWAFQGEAQILAERLGLDVVTAVSEGIAGKILMAQGDFDTALLRIRTARPASQESVADTTWIDALEGALYLKRGDLPAAQFWARQAELQPDQPLNYLHMERDITYGRLLLAGRALADGQAYIERLDQFAEERGYERWLISTRLLRALVAERLGDRHRALSLVTDAVKLAAPESYTRVFLDELPSILPLLLQVRHEAPSFVDAVMNAAPASVTSEQGDILSERELEVLRLLAAGLANAQIAERLVLSTGTVKQHMNHIYEKLHVHSRTQAIARARQLNLLP